jgi:hypothetical protein
MKQSSRKRQHCVELAGCVFEHRVEPIGERRVERPSRLFPGATASSRPDIAGEYRIDSSAARVVGPSHEQGAVHVRACCAARERKILLDELALEVLGVR